MFFYPFFCFSYAYILYKTHEEALEVFNSTSDLKIMGKDVIVVFATHKNGNESNENEDQSVTPSLKKQKVGNVP